MDLTLTRVVFEFRTNSYSSTGNKNLTLTRVVFELFMLAYVFLQKKI